MPTYEYICNTCGNEFEAFQSITAEPIEKCPQCGGSVTRKIGSGAGLVFKGSGFYITDYKKNNHSGSTSSKASKNDKAHGAKGPSDI